MASSNTQAHSNVGFSFLDITRASRLEKRQTGAFAAKHYSRPRSQRRTQKRSTIFVVVYQLANFTAEDQKWSSQPLQRKS